MKNKIKVQEQDSGQRLDIFLSKLDSIKTRSKAVKLIQKSCVHVNDNKVKASYQLRENDVILYEIPQEKIESIAPQNIPLDIVFEDKDIIVVNKQAGLVVHPSPGHYEDTLVNALLYHTKDLSMGFNELRPGIVHRIDKDTSGLLVVAKNDQSHANLSNQFFEKTTQRKYLAICFGVCREKSGKISSYLDRHPVDRKRWASNKEEKGRFAVTHFKVLGEYNKELSLLSLQLETGRTHQIRVHLSEMQIPIIGDWSYCNKRRLKNIKSVKLRKEIENMDRFALHAEVLGFTHPTTKEKMYFQTPPPQDLKYFFDLFYNDL